MISIMALYKGKGGLLLPHCKLHGDAKEMVSLDMASTSIGHYLKGQALTSSGLTLRPRPSSL